MIPNEAVEAAALMWATMDGKKDRFIADKSGSLGDEDGSYEGYMAEARVILNAAFAAMPEAAAASAAKIASRGPNGEAPVLVMRPPAPDLAAENERLRAALEIIRKGDVLVYDDELHCDVETSMSEDEMRVIAKAALERT